MDNYMLRIHSIKQLVQVVDDDKLVITGNRMKNISVLEKDGETFSLVVGKNGLIEAIGSDKDITEQYKTMCFDKIIDASGKTVMPGFVDGHSHCVWAGDRVHEFSMKLAGASYMEVHQAGGGIQFTVDCVRKATEEQLYADFKERLRRISQAGTTLLECKSGYGLDTVTEVKMLQVMERARSDPDVHVDISMTYCGAHSVPRGSTSEEATDDVINKQLPAVVDLVSRGELHVDNIDVFCEKGVFSCDQSRMILEHGKAAGMALNFHGEELNLLHAAEMGAELGARAISHLEEVCDEGMDAMAAAGTIAVVLPTTAYVLRLKPPPVRQMIDRGVAVALGSDLNPNAHCFAMPVVMHLACVLMHMSLEEVLVAATINAAASLGKSHSHGSLQEGKLADILVVDAPRWEHLVYQLGSYQHLITHVIKNGVVVHQRDSK